MHKLNRVFYRQDVAVLVFIEVIHHRGQCGGLARPRGPRDQHHAARLHRQGAKNFGSVELLQCQNLGRNRSEHCASTPIVIKGIDPKACQAVNFKRKIYL